jgi:hypothetical protein
MKRSLLSHLAFALGTALGVGNLLNCAPPNQERTTLALLASGYEVPSPLSVSPTTELELETAELAFGPFYLCASHTAGELCETARLEWLASQVIDLLDKRPHGLGDLEGATGRVESYMFDLGISSLLTSDKPVILDAAQGLDGASLRLRGQALVNGQSVPFRLDLPIAQTGAENVGIPVVLSQAGAPLGHDVETSDTSLSLRFAVADWLKGMDLSVYFEDQSCQDVDRSAVCAGNVAQTCEQGSSVSSIDCSLTGQVCIAGEGCATELKIDVDSPAARSIYSRIVTGSGPELIWNEDQTR